MFIQKKSQNASAIRFQSIILEIANHWKLYHNRKFVNYVNTDTVSSPTRSSRCRSKSPPVLCIQPSGTPTTAPSSTPSLSSSMPSVNPFLREVCHDVTHVAPKCSLFAHPSLVQLATVSNSLKRFDRPHIARYILLHLHPGNLCTRTWLGVAPHLSVYI